MPRFSFSTHVDAPPEMVFDLWTNLARMTEWVEGMSGVSDVTGPVDQVGTRYLVRFGPARSPTEVIEAERPRRFGTRFGNWYLRGTNHATFEPDRGGTTLTQTFETEGLIPAIVGRIFAAGSYKGSFRGELEAFARLAEAEARRPTGT